LLGRSRVLLATVGSTVLLGAATVTWSLYHLIAPIVPPAFLAVGDFGEPLMIMAAGSLLAFATFELRSPFPAWNDRFGPTLRRGMDLTLGVAMGGLYLWLGTSIHFWPEIVGTIQDHEILWVAMYALLGGALFSFLLERWTAMAVAGGVMAAGLSWGTWFEASIYPVFGFSLLYYVLDPVDEYLAIPLLAGPAPLGRTHRAPEDAPRAHRTTRSRSEPLNVLVSWGC